MKYRQDYTVETADHRLQSDYTKLYNSGCGDGWAARPNLFLVVFNTTRAPSTTAHFTFLVLLRNLGFITEVLEKEMHRDIWWSQITQRGYFLFLKTLFEFDHLFIWCGVWSRVETNYLQLSEDKCSFMIKSISNQKSLLRV